MMIDGILRRQETIIYFKLDRFTLTLSRVNSVGYKHSSRRWQQFPQKSYCNKATVSEGGLTQKIKINNNYYY